MLDEILAYLNNYFEDADNAVKGNFTVTGGTVSLPSVSPNIGYVMIYGSKFNDGLHHFPLYGLFDETFEGSIVPAMIPSAVLDIAEEIEAWKESNPASGFTSESFGGYTYQRAVIGGSFVGWANVFGKRLRRWRRL